MNSIYSIYEGILNDVDTAINVNDKVLHDMGYIKTYVHFSSSYARPDDLYILDQDKLKKATKGFELSTHSRYRYMDDRLKLLVTWLENVNFYELGFTQSIFSDKNELKKLQKKIERKLKSFFKIKVDIYLDNGNTATGRKTLWLTWKFIDPFIKTADNEKSASILFTETKD